MGPGNEGMEWGQGMGPGIETLHIGSLCLDFQMDLIPSSLRSQRLCDASSESASTATGSALVH